MVALARDRAKVKKRWIPYEKRKLSEVYTTMFACIEAGLLGKTALHRTRLLCRIGLYATSPLDISAFIRDGLVCKFGFYP